MARVGPNTPKIPPRGWLLPVLVLALLTLVAVAVVLAGHPPSDVAAVIGPLSPFALLALGRRRAG
ncbi:hypothetical protein GCM10011589_47300 [Modestobacter marinus]|uniref:Uncharacterized protein n=1 Tax=Modestobacter marinus TaxID=477641 RepID=A0ABQ2GC43_9ACTN|nr:hypothetical protein GCM10011589_47300 [Modestobacter marinus]